MSQHPVFPEFITTYQRVLISDWPIMAKLIFKHSHPLKEGGYKEANFKNNATNVLSERQIQDALQGPYSAFFLSQLKAFSIIARLTMVVKINKEDALKDNYTSLHPEFKIDPKKIENFQSTEVTHIREAFDELTNNQCQQWEGKLFFWQMSVTGALKINGVNISEMELDEFNAPEPLSELLARYDNVNITPPKVTYPLNFTDYFHLKAYLTVLSALSRQHLPHGEKEIEKHMKALKKPLKDIEKEQAELLKEQEAAVHDLLQPLHFIKIKK